ncbi:MAG: hypothetical protein A2172_05030 [Candidatus Woykebacteria bacterium RBG_13_40_15]|uniref:Uncharacterized protein n=1 Tax=Candidatus Woykebacteria bacterium RBG_13_40_15 TaxID=1802593 RepID=A0A1G1W8I4_9BACT|nr:MAG: hypothetical protein A2172_05030 [Candidatus Woykebacteria bacterium RBG_13_40_15]
MEIVTKLVTTVVFGGGWLLLLLGLVAIIPIATSQLRTVRPVNPFVDMLGEFVCMMAAVTLITVGGLMVLASTRAFGLM